MTADTYLYSRDAMSGYEAYLCALEGFCEYAQLEASDRNEATTRLQLIDRLFFDCLGCSRDAVVLEQPHGGEFADYVFAANRQSLVVEAKREGVYFEIPAGLDRIEMSIPALVRGSEALASALDSARLESHPWWRCRRWTSRYAECS